MSVRMQDCTELFDLMRSSFMHNKTPFIVTSVSNHDQILQDIRNEYRDFIHFETMEQIYERADDVGHQEYNGVIFSGMANVFWPTESSFSTFVKMMLNHRLNGSVQPLPAGPRILISVHASPEALLNDWRVYFQTHMSMDAQNVYRNVCKTHTGLYIQDFCWTGHGHVQVVSQLGRKWSFTIVCNGRDNVIH